MIGRDASAALQARGLLKPEPFKVFYKLRFDYASCVAAESVRSLAQSNSSQIALSRNF